MIKHNPENERIKRAYLIHLKAARGLNEATVDSVAKAIHRFEASTGYRNFKKFHVEQVLAFRRQLDEALAARSGKPLSKATILQTLNALRAFLLWLAERPGYRSRVRFSDADYCRLSDKETRIAKASQQRAIPTKQQIDKVLESLPSVTDIQRRNRAVIAFAWLTGVRDGALPSLKLKHVNTSEGRVNQDAREVKTKFSKSQTTAFFPVGGNARAIVTDWVDYLTKELCWGRDDPLFPATRVALGQNLQFEAAGLARKHWSDAGPIRTIFKDSFEQCGLPAFNPHSFRHALAMLGENTCITPEEFKAWSQNLGHEQVLTTLTSYGAVAPHRQAEIMRSFGSIRSESSELAELAVRMSELARRSAGQPTT